jgi:four helix bundle protein
MNEPQMKNRTKQFALRVLKLADALPTNRSGNAIANQLVRSGTSVAANYRALCRSKSRADFVNKTSIIEEEADETGFWLELIVDADLLSAKRVNLFSTKPAKLPRCSLQAVGPLLPVAANTIEIRNSRIENSESLRVPVRLRDAAFAFVFEKFVHRREQHPGTPGLDADVEVEFVLEEVEIGQARKIDAVER